MERKMSNNRDFTLNKYQELCEVIKNSGYSNMTIKEYLEKDRGLDSIILIRHDIDENIRFALDMAKVEAERNIKATYYFRMKKNVFEPEIIDKIASYGHEIGYHYETLDKSQGDIELAIRLFSEELALFREKYEVKTACMHGNPLTKFDNRKIWEKYQLNDFGLIGEPYLSIDYNQVAYFSDSGRTWNINKNKIKDTLKNGNAPSSISTTNNLIDIIKRSEYKNICILVHPERWPKNASDDCVRFCIDLMYNTGKRILIRQHA
jgi:hypothetical protein